MSITVTIMPVPTFYATIRPDGHRAGHICFSCATYSDLYTLLQTGPKHLAYGLKSNAQSFNCSQNYIIQNKEMHHFQLQRSNNWKNKRMKVAETEQCEHWEKGIKVKKQKCKRKMVL